MTPVERKQCIIDRLTQGLSPEFLEVTDDSHLHHGHPGARDGASHFSLTIVCQQFESIPLIQRHRLIYGLLADLIPHEIHALKIQANTPPS